MTGEAVADDMLRAGYERWYRLEEEKAAIGEDLKELFAELKGNGFTPKALRESFRRVRNINDADQQEHDAIVDLYVASLTGARPAREARVENIEQFPVEHDEDGVFPDDEPQSPQPAASDLTVPPSPGQVETHTLETANELPPPSRGIGGEDDLREPVATEQGQIAQEGDAPLEAAANANGEVLSGQSEHLSTHSVTNVTTLRQPKPLRPNCLKPEMCGGQGRNHCWACTKAMNEAGAA